MLSKFRQIPQGTRALVFPAERVPLHAMLTSAGHEVRTTPDYDWHGLRRGSRETALFQYTLRGAGRLRAGGREWKVGAGDAMILHFPADNRYWLPAGGTWEFLFVCVEGREALRLWREAETRLGLCAKLPEHSPAIDCLGRIVRAATREEIVTAPAASALAYELATSLLAERPTAGTRAAQAHAAGLQRSRDFADAHIGQAIGVGDLAAAAGLSRFHFSRLFAAETGQTPAAWLATRRVQKAAQWLRDGELPLKKISALCGFADVQMFGKVFRRLVGQPPGSYRRNGG